MKSKIYYQICILFLLIMINIYMKNLTAILRKEKKVKGDDLNSENENNFKGNSKKLYNNHTSKCFLISDEFINKIIHVVLTRFFVDFNEPINFLKKIGQQHYLVNGIRVMKKYLFPSLENQSCKQFIWILLLGDKANKTLIDNLLNFNYAFEYNNNKY